MNPIVTVATTIVITPFATEIATPESPSTRVAPPSEIAALTRSSRWYFVSRNPSRPRPCVTSCT